MTEHWLLLVYWVAGTTTITPMTGPQCHAMEALLSVREAVLSTNCISPKGCTGGVMFGTGKKVQCKLDE